MTTWAERLHQGLDGARRRLRRWWLQQRGVRMGTNCWIQDIEIPRNPGDVHLGNGVMLDRGVVLIASGAPVDPPRIRIGDSVYVNRSTIIDASEEIVIGAHTMIGPHCYITDHDHGTDTNASLGEQQLVGDAVVIGEDVWLGAGVSILKGVTVGTQAVVGAGAVVTKDVAPREIVGGVPARRLSVRG